MWHMKVQTARSILVWHEPHSILSFQDLGAMGSDSHHLKAISESSSLEASLFTMFPSSYQAKKNMMQKHGSDGCRVLLLREGGNAYLKKNASTAGRKTEKRGAVNRKVITSPQLSIFHQASRLMQACQRSTVKWNTLASFWHQRSNGALSSHWRGKMADVPATHTCAHTPHALSSLWCQRRGLDAQGPYCSVPCLLGSTCSYSALNRVFEPAVETFFSLFLAFSMFIFSSSYFDLFIPDHSYSWHPCTTLAGQT